MRMHLFLLLQTLLLPVWTGELAAQAATADALTSTGSTQIPFAFVSDTWGVWSGDTLLVVQHRFSGAPVFRAFDRDGNQVSQLTFTIPGASLIKIYGFARGLDGPLAVVGTAFTDDSRGASFLAWVSPEGGEQTIVRLRPFFPAAVTVASDGTIWIAGHDTTRNGGQRDYDQYLIRRYDKTGKMLGSFIPWSSLGTDPHTFSPDTNSILVSSRDRVGWYSRVSHTYIEFSTDGAVVKWVKTPEHPTDNILSVALCEDNRLFVGASVPNGPGHISSWGIFALDRQQGEWNFIPQNEKWGMLYGCDRTRLARTTNSKTISWLEPTGK